MKIYFHSKYDISLGVFNLLHPFDGRKFSKVHNAIKNQSELIVNKPEQPISQSAIDEYSGELLQRLLPSKRYILTALEVPYIPLLPFSVIDNRILLPMRWGVAGTFEAIKSAITGENAWNLSGGYHHASPKSAEGFCIYNDLGISYQQLCKQNHINKQDRIVIIDVDAHHGNGNALTFMDNQNITILDSFNNEIYPQGQYSKQRINISIPLSSGTTGDQYLTLLKQGLEQLEGNYRFAYVIAGTDVLASDPLGALALSIDDVVERDTLIIETLRKLSIPAVFTGGGGYSKDSAKAITSSICKLYTY